MKCGRTNPTKYPTMQSIEPDEHWVWHIVDDMMLN